MPCVGGYVSSSSFKVAAVAPKSLIASCDGGGALGVFDGPPLFWLPRASLWLPEFCKTLNLGLIVYYYLAISRFSCVEFCFDGYFICK